MGEEGESKNESGDERGQGRKEVDGTEAQITILGKTSFKKRKGAFPRGDSAEGLGQTPQNTSLHLGSNEDMI